LLMIVVAPWFLPNTIIWRGFETLIVKKIRQYSFQYSASLSE
jgi:hypothetical protein